MFHLPFGILSTDENVRATLYSILGTLRSDDGDKNIKKAIGLVTKITILYVHHAFLYITLLSLHDYDVKMPNFTLYRERTNFLPLFELGYCS